MVAACGKFKQAVLEEAAKLVAAGILKHPEEVFWFTLQEIKEMIETQRVDRKLITMRKEKFQQDAKMTPPRAITSEMEKAVAQLSNYHGVLEMRSKNATGEEWMIRRVELWSDGDKYAVLQNDPIAKKNLVGSVNTLNHCTS